jgi:hypothetical protein
MIEYDPYGPKVSKVKVFVKVMIRESKDCHEEPGHKLTLDVSTE